REAGRSAGPAGHQSRVGDQPEDRQGARPHRAAIAARSRRRGHRMRRRDLLALLGWRPRRVWAQEPGIPAVGFLGSSTAEAWAQFTASFRESLGNVGHDEGRNVVVEYRWANGDYDRLPPLTGDLLHRPVRVIVAAGTPA